jgi:MscS family membrane protein
MDPETYWWLVEVWGVEIWRLCGLFFSIFAGYFVSKLISLVILRFEKHVAERDRAILAVLAHALGRSTVFIGFALGIKLGILFLDLTPRVFSFATTVTSILVVGAIGWLLLCLSEVPTLIYARWSEKQESKLSDMLVPMIRTTLRITVVILTIVQMAQILSDKPITSIIAGLGIGGLAFALAAQDSLKHLFGSIVIFADRPFEVGDRLVIDGHDGPVEEVGFRSTRIRTLDGHLVTIPNGELVNKSILNISKRPHIRRIANITITYDTPPEKVERALAILREILDNHEGMHPDFPPRVYFNNFNDASLNLFVIYWYHPPAYWDFLAFGERFNLEVFRRFGEEGIEFAFPTQTLYLAGDEKRPLKLGIHDLDKLPPS